MPIARSVSISLLLSVVPLLGACGDDAGADIPPTPDASSAIDATPPIDGDLFNDAGPLTIGGDFTLAESMPSGLPTYGGQGVAAIGWMGSEYVAIEVSDKRHVLAQRLSPEGDMLGAPLEVARGAGTDIDFKVVCGGSRCLVVWRDVDQATGPDQVNLHGVMIGAGLEVVTPAPLALGPAESFALAPTANGFMVARTLTPDGLTLLSVDPSGAVAAVPGALFPDSSLSQAPVLACGLTTCLVAEYVCPATSGLCVRRLVVTDPTGQTADPVGQEQTTLPAAIVSTGAQLAAIYPDGPDGTQLQKLTDQGVPVGPPVVFAPRYQFSNAFFDGVAYVALGYLLEDQPGPGDVYLTHATLTRVALDGTVLIDQVNVFDDPAISGGGVAGCHDGLCLLAAGRWSGSIGDYAAVVTRLDAGQVLDPQGRLVTTSTPAQLLSEVASDGSDFLVVWRQQSLQGDEVRARRVGAHGTLSVAGSQLVVPSTTIAKTAIADVDGAYLFAWVDAADGKVRLLSLDAEGAPQAAPVELADVDLETYQYTSLGLACHAGQCLVAWTDDHVHVRRVRGDGVPIDAAEVVLQPRLSLAAVTVAYNRGQYAVGWVRHLQGQIDELDVALVAEDGPMVAPAVVVVTENISYFSGPKLAPSGDGFLVAWEGIALTADAVNQLKFAEMQGDGTLGPFTAAIGTATDYPVAMPELVTNGQDVLVTGILPLGSFDPTFDSDGRLRLLRVGAGPRLLDELPVDVGPVVFRWSTDVRGAANAQRDVLLVREVFSNDVGHIGPHAVGRLVKW
jgi:hypothetical protein